MRIIETSLPGVLVIESEVHQDERGFFFESYHLEKFRQLGLNDVFVQDNHSRSVKNSLRGLHYQLNQPQAKLCRVTRGEVLDVAVDIRVGSPRFGQWTGVVLSAENKRQIYIPRGFAHGYRVLSETADFLYKCDNFYLDEDERGLAWNDPGLAIQWEIEEPILSRKDMLNPTLANVSADNLPRFLPGRDEPRPLVSTFKITETIFA